MNGSLIPQNNNQTNEDQFKYLEFISDVDPILFRAKMSMLIKVNTK